MSDGQTSVSIASDIVISDDSTELMSATVQLLNPVFSNNEIINVTIPAGSNITMVQYSTVYSTSYIVFYRIFQVMKHIWY